MCLLLLGYPSPLGRCIDTHTHTLLQCVPLSIALCQKNGSDCFVAHHTSGMKASESALKQGRKSQKELFLRIQMHRFLTFRTSMLLYSF